MRKESADTQECENGKEVDMDENKEELSFITSTMSSSDGWREPKEGFNYCNIVSVVVEENGELYTIKFGEGCYNWRQDEREEPRANGQFWKRLVGMKRSRGKLAVDVGAMDLYAGRKIYPEESVTEAAVALSSGKRCRHTKKSWSYCKSARKCNC